MVNGSQRRVSKAAEVTLSSGFLIAVLGETWGYDMFLLCLLQYGVCVLCCCHCQILLFVNKNCRKSVLRVAFTECADGYFLIIVQ